MLNEKPFIVGFVPARGGSKSIPRKNLIRLNGRSLIERASQAIVSSKQVQVGVCSSDDGDILQEAARFDLASLRRPSHLGKDETSIVDVLLHDIPRIEAQFNQRPDIIVLIQPTSPFILGRHIDACVDALLGNSTACSAQTVARVPHNYHAINQRRVSSGHVEFVFQKDRLEQFNKQKKEQLFSFGNTLAFRVDAFFHMKNCFVEPSIAIEIEQKYAFDLDSSEDLEMARILVSGGLMV